jgi:hypothetical protein
MEESRYNCTNSLPRIHFRVNNLRYPLNRRLDGHQSRSGRCGEETSLLLQLVTNPDSSAVQPIARRYTDLAIPLINNDL